MRCQSWGDSEAKKKEGNQVQRFIITVPKRITYWVIISLGLLIELKVFKVL